VIDFISQHDGDFLKSFVNVMYRVAQKSKLLILAVNEINNNQTRVIFAKFIPTLVKKMFDMCSIVPNYSLKSLPPFVYTLVDERL